MNTNQSRENAPGAVSPGKAGLNFAIGTYGLLGGPVGWTVALVYFGIDNTIGWGNAIKSYIEIERNKADMRKLGIMTFSDFKY